MLQESREIIVEHEHARAVVSFVASVSESSIISLVRTVNELRKRRFYHDIELQIASPGGEVLALEYFIEALRHWQEDELDLTTCALTSCSSAAAVMLSLGIRRRKASPASSLLYHFSRIHAREHEPITQTRARSFVESLESIDKRILEELVSRAKKNKFEAKDFTKEDRHTLEKIRESLDRQARDGDPDPIPWLQNWIEAERWEELYRVLCESDRPISGRLAHALGLVDELVEPKPVQPERREDQRRKAPIITIPAWETVYKDGEVDVQHMKRHVLVMGETGSGKTKSAVLPVVAAACSSSQVSVALVIDPKKELYPEIQHVANGTGKRLVRIDPDKIKIDLMASEEWTVDELIEKKQYWTAAERVLQRVAGFSGTNPAGMLVGKQPTSREPYWDREGLQLATTVIAIAIWWSADWRFIALLIRDNLKEHMGTDQSNGWINLGNCFSKFHSMKERQRQWKWEEHIQKIRDDYAREFGAPASDFAFDSVFGVPWPEQVALLPPTNGLTSDKGTERIIYRDKVLSTKEIIDHDNVRYNKTLYYVLNYIWDPEAINEFYKNRCQSEDDYWEKLKKIEGISSKESELIDSAIKKFQELRNEEYNKIGDEHDIAPSADDLAYTVSRLMMIDGPYWDCGPACYDEDGIPHGLDYHPRRVEGGFSVFVDDELERLDSMRLGGRTMCEWRSALEKREREIREKSEREIETGKSNALEDMFPSLVAEELKDNDELAWKSVVEHAKIDRYLFRQRSGFPIKDDDDYWNDYFEVPVEDKTVFLKVLDDFRNLVTTDTLQAQAPNIIGIASRILNDLFSLDANGPNEIVKMMDGRSGEFETIVSTVKRFMGMREADKQYLGVHGHAASVMYEFSRPGVEQAVYFGCESVVRANRERKYMDAEHGAAPGSRFLDFREDLSKSDPSRGVMYIYQPSRHQHDELVAKVCKALFFEAVLDDPNRKEPDHTMPLAGYIADEFQRFITADRAHGEQSFLDVCRSFGGFAVLACQSIASLRYALCEMENDADKRSSAIDIICNNTGTKMFFRTTDEETSRRVSSISPVLSDGTSLIASRPLSTLEPGECYASFPDGRFTRAQLAQYKSPEEDEETESAVERNCVS